MPKRLNKPPTRDLNELAARIVEAAISDTPEPVEPVLPPKNPHAVALGRLGGKQSAIARAVKLTPEQRREIAKKAAAARWQHRPTDG